MRIKSVHLQNYKRFTDLKVEELPTTARLVVLLGPNGSGKSSLFDAFLFKGQNVPTIRSLSLDDYYQKQWDASQRLRSPQVWESIQVTLHSNEPSGSEWQSVFNVRSPYRNEPDFTVESIASMPSATTNPRFTRIIDADRAVQDNYQRLVWQRLQDLDSDAPATTTFGDYRETAIAELQSAITTLFPDLSLRDFSGITAESRGFRFAKGSVSDFPYKNLSGGEKGAFDLLLDMFVKRSEYGDAIYCIDEPEAHIAVATQGKLLEELLRLLPDDAQLWIATHSAGFVRRAYQRFQEKQDVVFLDFSNHDFDGPVALRPEPASRSFWRGVYQEALDDLAALVAPDRIILCESNRDRPGEGFDARCYNRIFEETHGDTLFISRGSASQVERSDDLKAVITAVHDGVEILKLIDRDDMSDEGRAERLSQGDLRILRRRELENYLYDEAVIRKLYETHGRTEVPHDVLSLLVDDPKRGDTRQTSRKVLNVTKRELSEVSLGNDRPEFERFHLVPALCATEGVYRELEADIFPCST